MEQAHETLHEAEVLEDARAYRGAINRAYYAMFYGVLALLATKQLGSSKHSGAVAMFDREFVKPGAFPAEFSRSLHLAFERRQVHDYGEMIEVDDATATAAVRDAREFVRSGEAWLTAQRLL
jgi:uncharacterized protein (UPF0332 family)